MWGAAILAALQAIPALVSGIRDLVDGIKQLKQEAIERALASYRAEVSADLKQIMGAKTNEERLKLADALSRHLGQ